MEKLWTNRDEALTDMQLIEYLWSDAVESLQQQALAHPLDRRFSAPE